MHSSTGYLTDFFREKNKELHNELPPELAERSIRHAAEERKRQASGELYRKSLLRPTYERLRREELADLEAFRYDAYPTPQRPLAQAIHERAIETETKARMAPTPIRAEIPFPFGLAIEPMMMAAVRQFEYDQDLIPTSLNVSPTQALSYPTTILVYKGISIPIVPARELETNIVRCIYYKEHK